MRADRLLAILLLLQTQRRLTATELAARLDVSLRTVQRDMQALSMAGAPVYAARGAGGGWSLLEGYHTELTGLSPMEVKSLTMLAPAPLLEDLGLRGAFTTGLVKLIASLPDAQRSAADEVRRRVYVDAAGWRATAEESPAFAIIQDAVWRDRKALVTYERSDGAVVERVIEPLGLVAKGKVWYVVAQAEGELRTYRIGRIRAASLLDEPVSRPAGFDLGAYWTTAQQAFSDSLPRYPAVVRLLAERLPFARAMWRYTRIADASAPDESGWVTAHVTFENLEEACFCILGLGAHAEALEPAELRDRIRQRADEMIRRQGKRATSTTSVTTTTTTTSVTATPGAHMRR